MLAVRRVAALCTHHARAEAHETRPWTNIYPKNKDGLPMYNPGGKYCVKLFWQVRRSIAHSGKQRLLITHELIPDPRKADDGWQGAWRKVTVDDLLPYDRVNHCLLPVSPIPFELWPTLLTKVPQHVAVSPTHVCRLCSRLCSSHTRSSPTRSILAARTCCNC